MLTLVSGGAASGKSEYAEGLISDFLGKKLYIATMRPFGEDAESKISRHHDLRAGKGFETIERYENLAGLDIPRNCAVLLECLSNLVANECFSTAGFGGAVERVLAGIDSIAKKAQELVVVTNEIFADGISYDKETSEYMKVLSAVNCEAAARADRVVEVVCGIPVSWKGRAVL